MKQSASSLIEAKTQILNYIARKNCPNKSQKMTNNQKRQNRERGQIALNLVSVIVI